MESRKEIENRIENNPYFQIIKKYDELQTHVYRSIQEILGKKHDSTPIRFDFKSSWGGLEIEFERLTLCISVNPSIKFKDTGEYFHKDEFDRYMLLAQRIIDFKKEIDYDGLNKDDFIQK